MKYSHVVQYALSRPWALSPDKLMAVQAFLALKASGDDVDPAEVRALVEAREARESEHLLAAQGAQRGNGRAVAVLPLYGVLTQRGGFDANTSESLTSTARWVGQLRALVADPGVSAVVIDVDSPGGEVGGTVEAADAVAELVAQDTKPIVAVSNTLMASAAYWIASQAESVVAAPSSLTGSIGVFTVHESVAKALEMKGIEVTAIAAGKFKTEHAPWAPLSADARDAMQAIVDASYRQFVDAVARGRGVKSSDVRNGFGEGRVLDAQRALDAGMVDRIDTLEATVARLAEGRYRKPRGERSEADAAREAMLADEQFMANNLAGHEEAERGEGMSVEAYMAVRRRRVALQGR